MSSNKVPQKLIKGLENLTAGSVPYVNSSGILAQNNSNLFWDNSNARLGVGTSSPRTKIAAFGTALSSFTGTDRGAIALDTTYTDGARQSIDFFAGAATSHPVARIATRYTAAGSFLEFGTSNNYVSGVTNLALSITPTGRVDVVSTGTSALQVYSTTSGGTSGIEVGALGSGNRYSYIDFVGDDTYTDYGLRLAREAGTNAPSFLHHRGTGALNIQAQEAGAIVLNTNGVNRLVVQSDGNFAFVPNGAPNTAVGITYNEGGGEIDIRDASANVRGFIDYNSGGTEFRLLTLNSTNMSLGTLNSNDLNFATNGSFRARITSAGHLIAFTDNAYTLGGSGNRWSAVWAANGTIQTSDERQKNSITDSDLGLEFIQSLRPVSYKWNVGQNEVSKDENDEMVVTPRAGVRTHYGLIAQEVKDVLGEKDFGGYIHDQETDHMGLRYDQFIAPLIKAVQELSQKIDDLQQEIDILKQ